VSKKDRTRSRAKELRRRKRRIGYRLRNREWADQERPFFRGTNIHYELSEKDRGMGAGGIGIFHKLVVRLGLAKEINQRVFVLKRHLPYWESDHVLNIAFNVLSGGTCIEDLELRRNDEVYLDALGAQRIPDPTTAGDFCRRFDSAHIEALMEAINRTRLRVWKQQPDEFFEEAIIEADGTLAPTTGECKQGMDVAYKGTWGYHPLLVSLANTREPLYLVNRSGNRPSHEGAAARFDQAIALCREAGFRRILLRGDTDFSQTAHLDRWDEQGVRFLFGFDAVAPLVKMAQELPKRAWKRLVRPDKYAVATEPRTRPENIKEQIVRDRKFENIRLQWEDVAEFSYSPTACRKTYRIIVVRKNLTHEKGEQVLFPEIRYFFYIANDWTTTPEELVFLANERCDQENLIDQLKNGVQAMRMPTDTLESNWAYMVMASLAWTIKAWFALLLPVAGPWKDKHAAEKWAVLRMEFKQFLNAFVRLPCQLVVGGRRLLFRLLGWNPWLHVFLRGVQAVSLQ
jgi:hypothetical protein